MKSRQGKREHIWTPLPMDYLLEMHSLFSAKVIIALTSWILLIGLTLATTLYLLPNPEIMLMGGDTEVIHFFLFNPALILGLVLFFWFGFEWGFIPVFLSTFIIAFHSNMPWGWALIFGISFVLGMTIYALAYQSFKIPYNLRSLRSLAFFISISFIASIASSLGSFIWSLTHSLSALDTLTLWKGWWSGGFLQSVLFIGPILLLLTPFVEKVKKHYFIIPEPPAISMNWVYGSVISVTVILVIFIFSGKILGEMRVQEVIEAGQAVTQGSIISALESFEIISWISVGMIIITGYGAIHIISGWNRNLNNEVDKRTFELNQSQEKLKESLHEKEFLLKEIHHRVKNNLALVSALLELQELSGNHHDADQKEMFQTSRARIKSMALAHEALYQTENFSSINMSNFVERIVNLTHNSFAPSDGSISLNLELDDALLNMKRSISLGLMLNEILINAYKHAFNGRSEGAINVHSNRSGNNITLTISDNGIGMPEKSRPHSLGMKLIRKLAKQLSATLDINSTDEGTSYKLVFEVNKAPENTFHPQ